MRKFVFRLAAAVFAAASCFVVCEGRALAAVGYGLVAGSLLLAAGDRRPKAVRVEDEDDSVVQFGWGNHESLRQVQK